MNKKELKEFNDFLNLTISHQDTQTNHPLLKKIEAERAEQAKLLEPEQAKIKAQWDRKRSTIKKERFMAVFQESQQV